MFLEQVKAHFAQAASAADTSSGPTKVVRSLCDILFSQALLPLTAASWFPQSTKRAPKTQKIKVEQPTVSLSKLNCSNTKRVLNAGRKPTLLHVHQVCRAPVLQSRDSMF